jgi:hypothetical protein
MTRGRRPTVKRLCYESFGQGAVNRAGTAQEQWHIICGVVASWGRFDCVPQASLPALGGQGWVQLHVHQLPVAAGIHEQTCQCGLEGGFECLCRLEACGIHGARDR